MHSFGARQPGYSYPYTELVKDLKGNAVYGTVFIECGSKYQPGWPMQDPLASLPESKWVQSIANESDAPMAIVAHLDLTQGRDAVERAVTAHVKAAPNLVGIRHSLAWHKDAPVFSRKFEGQTEEVSRNGLFHEGMEVLAKHGLSYDVWLFHTNLHNSSIWHAPAPKHRSSVTTWVAPWAALQRAFRWKHSCRNGALIWLSSPNAKMYASSCQVCLC